MTSHRLAIMHDYNGINFPNAVLLSKAPERRLGMMMLIVVAKDGIRRYCGSGCYVWFHSMLDISLGGWVPGIAVLVPYIVPSGMQPWRAV
jgi:hypothetical protein